VATLEAWYSNERREQTVRAATRNAPRWVIAGINRQRKAEGRSALPMPEHRSEAKRSRHVVLVGACAPGLSQPVHCANDGLKLAEMVAPSAYDHCLRLVKARAVNVELRAGHLGEPITDTKSGGLEFLTTPGTGLMLVARVPLARANAQMLAAALGGTMRLSIGFKPRRTEIVKHNGRRVRSFHEIDVQHVAALWDDAEHGVPCFRSAKVFAAFDHDERDVRRAMKAAGLHANIAEMRKGWN